MNEDILSSLKAGANEHLSKPFSPQELIHILGKYLLANESAPANS